MISNGLYSIRPYNNQQLAISIQKKSEENEAPLLYEEWENGEHQMFYLLKDKDDGFSIKMLKENSKSENFGVKRKNKKKNCLS